jgi:hypothetical protein
MNAFNALWHLDMRELHCIDDALLVLLPKSHPHHGKANVQSPS